MPFTTFNAGDVNLASLTGSSLICTATSNGGTGQESAARCFNGLSTGKFHVEFTATALGGTTFAPCVGFYTAATAIASAFAGGFPSGVGIVPAGVFLWSGSGSSGVVGAFTTPNVVSLEIDLSAHLIWASINGGNWNNSGTANPATGTGGITYSGVSVPVMPGVSSTDSNGTHSSFTLNAGATSFTKAASAGFVGWPLTNVVLPTSEFFFGAN